MMLEFFVAGTPAAQGSAKAFVVAGRAHVTHDSKRTMPWRQQVWATAAHHVDLAGWTVEPDAPLDVELEFALIRPRGHFGKRGIKPSAPSWPAKKPDIDKLTRCVLDGLTGVVYADDSRVVSVHARKVYATEGQPAGATIRVKQQGETR